MAVSHWKTLYSDRDAQWDEVIEIKGEEVPPTVTWGTSPEQALPLSATVPVPEEIEDPVKREAAKRAIQYMGLTPGEAIAELKVDRVFIGSAANSLLEDLHAAAKEIEGHKVADGVRAIVVPGSGLVRAQAEAEGLDKIFTDAGCEWREPGCSMCLGIIRTRLSRVSVAHRRQTEISKVVRAVMVVRTL